MPFRTQGDQLYILGGVNYLDGPQTFPNWPQHYKFEKPTNTNNSVYMRGGS